MKPIHGLTAADLARAPVWEWAHGEEDADETYVRATAHVTVPAGDEFHVACDLLTAQGRRLVGFVSIADGEVQLGCWPIAVGDGQYCPLDTPPHGRKERAAFEALFGAAFAQVFPVRWRTRAAIGAQRVYLEGVIDQPPRP